MVKAKRGRGKAPAPAGPTKKRNLKRDRADVYEAEDQEPEEERFAGQRYDRTETFEYELPEDFEDEEIDEDEAFNSEDERQFGHIFGDDAAGDDDEDMGELGEGAMEGDGGDDFNYASSSDPEAEGNEQNPRRKKARHGAAAAGSAGAGSGSGDDMSSDEDAEADVGGEFGDEESEEFDLEGEEGEEGEEDEERHAAMLAAVREGGGLGRGARRRAPLLSEAAPESEYNLQPGAASGGVGGRLSVAAMLESLGPDRSKVGAVRKLLERSQKEKQLAPPLPGNIQAALQREAGYEVRKKDISKWTQLVKGNREAPTLVLTSGRGDVPAITTTAALAARVTPVTDMEREVADLLKSSGAHNEASIIEAEQSLVVKAVSAEEVRERSGRLAKLRSLLFHQETRMKHAAKIKSKAHKKRANRAAKLKALQSGVMEDENFIRLEAEAKERQRIEERTTMKHRNTSKWSRRILKRGAIAIDDGSKAAIAEQLRMHQELRRKVAAPESDDGSDSDSLTEASDDEGADARRDAQAAGELQSLLDTGGRNEEGAQKGLGNLPFMKRAAERNMAEVEEKIREMKRQLEALNDSGEEGDAAADAAPRGRFRFGGASTQPVPEASGETDSAQMESDEDEDAESKAERLQSLVMARTGNGATPAEAAAQLPSTGDVHGDAGGKRGKKPKKTAKGRPGIEPEAELPEDVMDGWNFRTASTEGRMAVQAVQAVKGTGAKAKGIDAKANALPPVSFGPASASKAATTRQTNSTAEASAGGDAAGFIPSSDFAGARAGYVFKKGPQGTRYYKDATVPALSRAGEKSGAEKSGGGKSGVEKAGTKKARGEKAGVAEKGRGPGGPPLTNGVDHVSPLANGVDHVSSDEEEDQLAMQATGNAVTQRDLIARAFAGDDVVEEFEKAKAAEAEAELPQLEDPTLLPGWGAWAGQQKRKPEWFLKAAAKNKREREAAAARRKDAKLKGVIISERWDKKAAKYLTPSVPFPFDSRDTYERSMRQPLGKEYNTDVVFRDLTRPPIIKAAGSVIQPLRYNKAASASTQHTGHNALRKKTAVVAGGMVRNSKK